MARIVQVKQCRMKRREFDSGALKDVREERDIYLQLVTFTKPQEISLSVACLHPYKPEVKFCRALLP